MAVAMSLLVVPAFFGLLFGVYVLLEAAAFRNPLLFLIPAFLRMSRKRILSLLATPTGSPLGLSFPLVFSTYYLMVIALPAIPREPFFWIVRLVGTAVFIQSLMLFIEVRREEQRKVAAWMKRRLDAIASGNHSELPRPVRGKYPLIYLFHVINSLLVVVLWNISVVNLQ